MGLRRQSMSRTIYQTKELRAREGKVEDLGNEE